MYQTDHKYSASHVASTWYLNGRRLPSGARLGPLKKPFLNVFQSLTIWKLQHPGWRHLWVSADNWPAYTLHIQPWMPWQLLPLCWPYSWSRWHYSCPNKTSAQVLWWVTSHIAVIALEVVPIKYNLGCVCIAYRVTPILALAVPRIKLCK